MRIPPTLFALALCAASVGAASAQQAVAPVTGNAFSGIGLAYDAPHGQLTASGISLKPTKKSSVSNLTTGTIDVTITIRVVSSYAPGTSYPCSVMAIGGNIDLERGTVDGGIVTQNSVSPVVSTPAGNTVTCFVTLPYAWDLAGGAHESSGLIIAYAAAAVSAQGNTQRSTLQVSGIEDLPANGATTKLAFDAAL